MNGLINLFKPSGMSSAQAVSRVRHILGEKTVGHMGTLDPMAEGVLVIGVGKSTRLFDAFGKCRKTYVAKFEFGYQTDTLDKLGKVIKTTPDIPSDEAVTHAMKSLVGEIEQVPPAYSAKHIGGKRAYELARSGQDVQLVPSKVTIYDINLVIQPSPKELVYEIICSSGTYIRSICRDAAKMCGSLATMTFLQRTQIGSFFIRDSVTLEELEKRPPEEYLVPPEKALNFIPCHFVPDELWDDLCHGRKIACPPINDSRIYCRDVLFGIGRDVDGVLKLKTYLKDD